MSKSQQELYKEFNNELAELAQIYNSPLFSSIFQKEEISASETPKSSIGSEQSQTIQDSTACSLLLTPLYEFQQKTIDTLQKELEQLQLSYKNLQTKFDENLIELDACKNDLILKVRFLIHKNTKCLLLMKSIKL